jgi:hypothetical protein
MRSRFCYALILVSLLDVLAACGGGGHSFAPTPSSAGGFWSGTLTVDGVPQGISGVVSESRQFHFFADDRAQYYGTLTINGNRGSASVTGLAPEGGTFGDGSVRGTGTLDVTIQQRSKLTATGTFTSASNNTSNVSMTVNYDPSYETASSLGAINGDFKNTADPGQTINLSGGQFTYSDFSTGCMANGTVSIIDARYNLYDIQFTYASTNNCQAKSGVILQGLLTIGTTQNGVEMAIYMHGTAQGEPIAQISVYQPL